jgi:shikimate dehydrogenase
MAALKLAVVGDPVAHSRSPEIFTAMLSQAGLAGTYEAIRVPSGMGARTFAALRDEGYTGLNVTTPLKVEALEAADTLDDIARAAGSVNLLLLGDRLAGYNTDGAGALGALAAAGLGNLEGSRLLILGAGPTARAATLAIRSMGARVDIWNRTQARANEIVASLGAQHYESDVRYDAILSTLLPGVEIADVDAQVANSIASATIVIDANYGSRSTLAQNFNRESVIDGFEMLHASARASFSIFTHER